MLNEIIITIILLPLPFRLLFCLLGGLKRRPRKTAEAKKGREPERRWEIHSVFIYLHLSGAGTRARRDREARNACMQDGDGNFVNYENCSPRFACDSRNEILEGSFSPPEKVGKKTQQICMHNRMTGQRGWFSLDCHIVVEWLDKKKSFLPITYQPRCTSIMQYITSKCFRSRDFNGKSCSRSKQVWWLFSSCIPNSYSKGRKNDVTMAAA